MSKIERRKRDHKGTKREQTLAELMNLKVEIGDIEELFEAWRLRD
jgi:hypothetical protein